MNHFLGFTDAHILALRLYGRTGTDNTPYSDKSCLGQHSDLREFKSGEISGRTLLAGQAECRGQFSERWGAVAFAGLSKLWDEDLEALITKDLYYSTGVGIRFMINTDQKINFRVDAAVGNSDNKGIYVVFGRPFKAKAQALRHHTPLETSAGSHTGAMVRHRQLKRIVR